MKKIFLTIIMIIAILNMVNALTYTDNLRTYHAFNETSGTTFSESGLGSFSYSFSSNAAVPTFYSSTDCLDGVSCVGFNRLSEYGGAEISNYWLSSGVNKTLLAWINPGEGLGSWRTYIGADNQMKIVQDSSGNIECQTRDSGGSWTSFDYGTLTSLKDQWNLYICGWDNSNQEIFGSLNCSSYTTQSVGTTEYGSSEYAGVGGANKNNQLNNATFQHVALYSEVLSVSNCENYLSDTSGASDSSFEGLVLDLSFDDVSDCGNDDTGRHKDFDTNGAVSCLNDTSVCKWFGCGNFSTEGGDFLNGTSNFDLTSNLSVVFWLYLDEHPTGADSQGFFEIGDSATNNYLYEEEGDYGISTRWNAQTGEISVSPGESDGTLAGYWTHYALIYDGATYSTYKDGVLAVSSSVSYGNINYTNNSLINVGRGIYGIDMLGLMDEFQIYNTALTQEEVITLYNEQVGGTPPDYDLYIYNVTKNETHFVYSIKSRGLLNITSSFSTNIYYDDVSQCINTASSGLNTGSILTYSCLLPTWDTGVRTISLSTDYTSQITEYLSEDNNNISFPYNTNNFPRMHPELNTTWLTSNTDSPAYMAYDSIRNFASDDFNPSWDEGDVDPRAKKGWENAMSCYLTNYVSSSGNDECGRAINHLEGWLNGTITPSDYAGGNVQITHEFYSVGLTYDLMYNNLTSNQRTVYANKINDICVAMYKSPSILLMSDKEELFPGNGKGFGTGLGASCWTISGLVEDNPGLLSIPPGTLEQFSINDGWINRLKWYLQGNQGDRSAEGILYANYGQYHSLFLAWSIINSGYLTINQSDINGLLIGNINYMLDFNDLGTSIGDRAQRLKFYSFGDTHPYDELGEINQIGASLYTVLGVLSDNQTIKNLALTSRNIIFEKESSGVNAHIRPIIDMWFYPLLDLSADNLTTQEMQNSMKQGYVGRTWDYLYLRNNRTFVDDTVIIVDGGDMPSWGHPNAEFSLYVYAMGENWLDYGAVPYEDDIRSEWWQNTISLQDDDSSYWWNDGYSAPINQPYGGAISAWKTDYPNANFMPGYSRGSINDTFVLTAEQGFGGGARMFQPYLYNSTQDFERRVIVYDDFIIEAYIVNRTPQGFASMSFLNYLELYPGSVSGTNLTYTHGNKVYEVSVLYESTPLTLQGGNTGVLAGDEKTIYGGFNVTYQRYEYVTNSADNEIFVFLHHWHDTTDKDYSIISDTNEYGISVDGEKATLLFNSNEWYNMSVLGSPCVENIINSSFSSFTYSSCVNNTRNGSRYLTEHDQNFCGSYINVTYWDNRTGLVCGLSDEEIGLSIPGLTGYIIILIVAGLFGMMYALFNSRKISDVGNILALIVSMVTIIVGIMVLAATI